MREKKGKIKKKNKKTEEIKTMKNNKNNYFWQSHDLQILEEEGSVYIKIVRIDAVLHPLPQQVTGIWLYWSTLKGVNFESQHQPGLNSERHAAKRSVGNSTDSPNPSVAPTPPNSTAAIPRRFPNPSPSPPQHPLLHQFYPCTALMVIIIRRISKGIFFFVRISKFWVQISLKTNLLFIILGVKEINITWAEGSI